MSEKKRALRREWRDVKGFWFLETSNSQHGTCCNTNYKLCMSVTDLELTHHNLFVVTDQSSTCVGNAELRCNAPIT